VPGSVPMFDGAFIPIVAFVTRRPCYRCMHPHVDPIPLVLEVSLTFDPLSTIDSCDRQFKGQPHLTVDNR
jgi:hypothetical protein